MAYAEASQSRWAALAGALALCAGAARADSPLTSIDFARAYADVPGVQSAREANLPAAYVFLASTASSETKLAVMSALGWERGDSASGFLEALAQDKGVPVAQLRLEDLTPSQAFAAGWLVALARYLDLAPLQPGSKGVRGLPPGAFLDFAAARLPDDFAVQYARALVQAQALMAGDWCQVFRVPDAVVKRFPPARRNLRPAALEAAQGYLALYEQECAGTKAAQREAREALNQYYSLSRLGPQVVGGTQGGVVVWDQERDAPVATRAGFLCSGLTWKAAVWVGCEGEVLRWDGARFTSYLRREAKGSAEYYRPMAGPAGALWVRLGGKTWAYDEAANRFAPVKAPWRGDPYDALFFEGVPTWVDFLRAVHVGEKTVALKSETYPGSDPRRFRVDARGRLWVEDFEAGLFRWEPDKGRFVRHAGLEAKATGVVVDTARERLWLLHYTQGLVLQREGGAQGQRVDLAELGNMRDLLLDAATGDVWVGGWGQLVRVRAGDQGAWEVRPFRVR